MATHERRAAVTQREKRLSEEKWQMRGIAPDGMLHSLSFTTLDADGVTEIVSGACHLGGIDIWAIEIADELGLDTIEYQPKTRSWADGYKPRNLQIARRSDIVHCITVKELPEGYTGMRFPFCYHCGTSDHVKSGGCWTMKEARKIGKGGELHVIGKVRAEVKTEEK